jgi:hypothetical protein
MGAVAKPANETEPGERNGRIPARPESGRVHRQLITNRANWLEINVRSRDPTQSGPASPEE